MYAMSHRRSFARALLAGAFACLLAAPLAAQTLNDTVRRVERETGGRILSAETVSFGSRQVYRIKVLTPDGRVRVVQEPVPGGTAFSPRSREAPPRDDRLERYEQRNERDERSEPPNTFAPRERGYVPRRERPREMPQQRSAPREAPPPVQRERRERGARDQRDDE